MKLEASKGLYSGTDRDYVVWVKDESKKKRLIGGYTRDRKIGLTKDAPLEIIGSYFHEVGHILERSGGVDFLTPDEVKETSIRLSTIEVMDMIAFLADDKLRWLSAYVKGACNRIISTYTRWTFDPTRLEVAHLTFDEYKQKIFQLNSNAFERGTVEGRTAVGERFDAYARDSEMYSVACEIGCLYLLENSLNANRLFRFFHRSPLNITLQSTKGMPYERAHNIVARAYAGTGWKIP